MDAVRTDRCSLFGYGRPTTPTLEKLAGSSVIFSRAYSPSTGSFFSISAMHGGVHPATIVGRGASEPSVLAERLGEEGYRTLACFLPVIIRPPDPNWPAFDRSMGFSTWEPVGDATTVVDRLLREVGEARDEPFFFYAHVMDPHTPT